MLLEEALGGLSLNDFKRYAQESGLEYLGPAPQFPCSGFPLTGKMVPGNHLLLVNLPVKIPEGLSASARAINATFIIVTFASTVVLAPETIDKLYPGDCARPTDPDQRLVSVYTEKEIRYETVPHSPVYEGMNILGANFFVDNGLQLFANYASQTVVIDK